jgi:hypothetical protein
LKLLFAHGDPIFKVALAILTAKNYSIFYAFEINAKLLVQQNEYSQNMLPIALASLPICVSRALIKPFALRMLKI